MFLLSIIILFGFLLASYFLKLAHKRPAVIVVDPQNNSDLISENTSVSTYILRLTNGPINNSTITSKTVYLTQKQTGAIIPSIVNVSGGGYGITLMPASPLKLNTSLTNDDFLFPFVAHISQAWKFRAILPIAAPISHPK